MDYYNLIKEELINNEVYKKGKDYSKNKHDLQTYYNVGKLLIDAQGGETRAKYGDGIIKEYSIRLTNELGHGYSTRSLKNMRKFYLFQNGQALPAQSSLSWSHWCELIKVNDEYAINYYIDITNKQNLSYRKLGEKIKSQEYERLDDKTKLKLIKKEKTNIEDFVKNPIVIKSNKNIDYEHISELALKRLILENLDDFMAELGDGFAYVGEEYKIKIGNSYNYIDILLFNYIYNSFVVIELKVTELKKEHLGQIETYMNYVDKNIKTIKQEKTIGIIICRKDNKLLLEYSSDKRIMTREFLLL